MKMDEKGDGDSLEDVVAGRATDYVTTLSTDAASLSDSDPEDLGIPEDAEVHALSPEDGLILLDGIKPPGVLSSKQKSPVQPFHLKGMTSTFSVRSQSIFDALEEPTNRVTACPVPVPEWNFKRPFPPGPLVQSPGAGPTRQKKPAITVPDYVAHPERWTKYSLEDVAETSNRTNAMVAQEFIQDMRRRKVNESVPVMTGDYIPAFNQDSFSNATERILFAKPVKSIVPMEAEDGVKKEAGRVSGLGLPKIAAKWVEEEDEDEEAGGEKVPLSLSKAEVEEKKEGKELTASNVVSALDKESSRQLGFHSNKKRIKKNLRTRVDPADDEDS